MATRAELRGRESLRLRPRAGARRVEDHRVQPVELGPASGARSRSRVSAITRSPKSARARRTAERRQHGRPASRPHAPGSPRRRAAARTCRSRRTDRQDSLRVADRARDRRADLRLGLNAGLQERAGRQLDGDAAERHAHRPAPHDRLGLVTGARAATTPARDPARRRRRRCCSRSARPGAARGRAARRSRPLSVAVTSTSPPRAGERQAAQAPRAAAPAEPTISGSTTAQASTSTTCWPARLAKAERDLGAMTLEGEAGAPPGRGRHRAGGAIAISIETAPGERRGHLVAPARRYRAPADAAAGSRRRCRNAGSVAPRAAPPRARRAARPRNRRSRRAPRRTARRSPGRVSGTKTLRPPCGRCRRRGRRPRRSPPRPARRPAAPRPARAARSLLTARICSRLSRAPVRDRRAPRTVGRRRRRRAGSGAAVRHDLLDARAGRQRHAERTPGAGSALARRGSAGARRRGGSARFTVARSTSSATSSAVPATSAMPPAITKTLSARAMLSTLAADHAHRTVP